jgi:hypothetical protein
MRKKGKAGKVLVAFSEALLLISLSFAIAFFFSENAAATNGAGVGAGLGGGAGFGVGVGGGAVGFGLGAEAAQRPSITGSPTKSSGLERSGVGSTPATFDTGQPWSFPSDYKVGDTVANIEKGTYQTVTSVDKGKPILNDGTRINDKNIENFGHIKSLDTTKLTKGTGVSYRGNDYTITGTSTNEVGGSFYTTKQGDQIPTGGDIEVTGAAGAGAATQAGWSWGNLGRGVTWAWQSYAIVQIVGPILGMEESETDALSAAVAAGGFIARSLDGAWGLSKGWARGIGIFAGILIFKALYKSERSTMVSFNCLPYEAPLGGDECERCNMDIFRPCTEYRCRALGQSCQLLNPGTEDEKCAWVNPNNVKSPTITPWADILRPLEDLSYTNIEIKPPNIRMQIVRGEDDCIPAFTPLRFGITTDEPAQCKVDSEHKQKFEDMQFYFGENNYFLYNHTHEMTLPGATLESGVSSPILKNDGTMELFVRCADANGNENVDEFAISFCVDPSPDTTPPLIVGSSLEDGAPVKAGVDNSSIELYVNEAVECRWSKSDAVYETMENEMACSLTDLNADGNNICSGTLTGIQDQAENKFYFRCKDRPAAIDEANRNVMVQGYRLILRGTQSLEIIKVGPNETAIGSTTAVDVGLYVKTDDGADEGKSECMFSLTGEPGSYIEMFETNSFEHRQIVSLGTGSYEYSFVCTDAGGNSAKETVSFNVEVDKNPPVVARAFKQAPDSLKIITNEDAECVYSLNSCNFVFDEGLNMIYSNPNIKTLHFAEWDTGVTYYIKCKDMLGNEPNPNVCSVIISAVEV